MKKISFKVAVLTAMLSFASCGGEQKATTTEESAPITEQPASEATEIEAEEEEVAATESEDAKVAEEEVKDEKADPKFDKALDKIEKEVKKLAEMAGKIGNGYGVLDVQEKQKEIDAELKKINVEELSSKQRARYDKLSLDIVKAVSSTAGSLMKALF